MASNDRIRLFKNPGAKKWSAELTFPDGTSEVIQTEFTEQRPAAMSAGHIWGKAARERGLVPPKASKASSAPAALIAAARQGTPMPTNGTHSSASRLAGLAKVIGVLDGISGEIDRLDPADKEWLKTTVFRS